jgi:hypothetical protein
LVVEHATCPVGIFEKIVWTTIAAKTAMIAAATQRP